MNETEYDALMRKALRDQLLWDAMTADETDREQVFDWITSAKAQTIDMLARRKAEWTASAHRLTPGTAEYRARLADYSEWRKRALGFLAIVSQRKRDMKALHRPTRIARANDERERFNNSLIFLAQRIADHEGGRISDAELHQVIDVIALPHGLGGEISLRDVLHLMKREVSA